MKEGNRKKDFGKSEEAKPQKPYADFPSSPHAGRKWPTKIRGKSHFFDKWGRIVGSVMDQLLPLPDTG